jgi:hypothetical protein
MQGVLGRARLVFLRGVCVGAAGQLDPMATAPSSSHAATMCGQWCLRAHVGKDDEGAAHEPYLDVIDGAVPTDAITRAWIK